MITFVNKWDRPGRDALRLCDELVDRIGLPPMPVTWPVGEAGRFRSVVDRTDGRFIRYLRTVGGATAAPEQHLDADRAAAEEGEDWTRSTAIVGGFIEPRESSKAGGHR